MMLQSHANFRQQVADVWLTKLFFFQVRSHPHKIMSLKRLTSLSYVVSDQLERQWLDS